MRNCVSDCRPMPVVRPLHSVRRRTILFTASEADPCYIAVALCADFTVHQPLHRTQQPSNPAIRNSLTESGKARCKSFPLRITA
jgi:hypothetical protein